MENDILNGQPREFGNLELLARHVVEGFITGLHKSPFHGFSVEFAEHRQYNTNESTRHIDWKLYGRTEKLFVKRFEEETNLRCQLVIDSSSSMYYPEVKELNIHNLNKVLFSALCSASLIHILRRQRDAVGLSLFSESLELHTNARSSSVHHQLLFSELHKLISREGITQNRKTSAAAALHQIAEAVHKRSLVVIFSDMMDNSDQNEDMFSALQHLRHNKHEVILFYVLDKSREVDFRFDNRPYRFVDMETGEEVRAHPNEVRETYIQSIFKYREQLRLKCAQYSIDMVEVDVKTGLTGVLTSYLVKRQRMF